MLTRTAALAALVLVAAAAPAGAYVLSDAADTPGGSHASPHAGKAHHDKQHAEGADSDEAGGDDSGEHADDASAAGRAHAEAMKAWAHCVAAAASGPMAGERCGPPKDACGEKPMPPGLAQHQRAHTGPFAPGKGGAQEKGAHGSAHGRSSG